MELIQLTPCMEVDHSLHLRSPGEVLLLDYMLPATMNHQQLARRTGIQASHLREFLTDARPMTPRHAIRLALVLDTTPLYWLVLQARYDLAREAQRDATHQSLDVGARQQCSADDKGRMCYQGNFHSPPIG